MASKAPPIPPDQRSSPNDKPHIEGARRSGKGNANLNTREQGRHGNINQNTHHQGYQQDR
jgi:hypothetical protein